jgi:hypothetical protein
VGDPCGEAAPGQTQGGLHALHRHRRSRRRRQCRRGEADGRKEDQKIYRRHSGYEGGLREERAGVVRKRQPMRLVEEAVRGMLPKSKMGDQMYRKLKVYARAIIRTPLSNRENRGPVTLASTEYYATGRRKTSAARVFLRPARASSR